MTHDDSGAHPGPGEERDARIAVDLRVTGRVQGVNFRTATQDQALHHGVDGWVRNESDGTVGVHLEGSPDAVDAVTEWCQRGPAHAAVDRVEATEATSTGERGFRVRS